MCANSTDQPLLGNAVTSPKACAGRCKSAVGQKATAELQVPCGAAGADALTDPTGHRGGDGRSVAFKRILVAVDASEQSGYAVDVAARLARQLGADAVLVNVFLADRPFSWEFKFVDAEVRSRCVTGGESLLDQAKARMPHGVHVEKVLRDGEAALEIVNAAIVYAADLIVMGTHGRGRIGHAVLGSVANAVTRQAPCPVLTVAHAPPPMTSEVTRDWAEQKREVILETT